MNKDLNILFVSLNHKNLRKYIIFVLITNKIILYVCVLLTTHLNP